MGIGTAIGLAATVASAGAGVGGVIESGKASGQASKSAQANQDIATQELGDKQQIFQQLQPFYSQYLDKGSPYLQNIQSAAAGQNAQQQNNAAGMFRQQMGQTGLGYGASGTTAAGLGQLGQAGAQQSANTYLSNLLNNEQVKFQAAQGLQGAGNMMSQQNTVGQTPQPVQSTLGSSVGALGQVLDGFAQPGTPFIPTNPASPSNGNITNQFPFPGTQGWIT